MRLVAASAETKGEPAPMERSDDELMLLARGGVESAFDELVRRHQRRVLRVAARYLGSGSASLVHDIAQDTFLEIYRGLHRYQPRGKFVPYLHGVLINRCRMAHRSARYEGQALRHHGAGAVATADGSSEAEVLARERRRDLEAAIGKLSHKLRDVVVLRFNAELDYAQIAETLRVPVGTVKRRLFDAMKALHAVVEKERP